MFKATGSDWCTEELSCLHGLQHESCWGDFLCQLVCRTRPEIGQFPVKSRADTECKERMLTDTGSDSSTFASSAGVVGGNPELWTGHGEAFCYLFEMLIHVCRNG